MSVFRIICVIALLISAVALPLFLTVLIGLFCLYRFPDFYEIIPIFFINDAMYGFQSLRFFDIPYIMTICAVCAVALASLLHKKLFGVHSPLS